MTHMVIRPPATYDERYEYLLYPAPLTDPPPGSKMAAMTFVTVCTFATNLHRLREARGLTRPAVAEAVDVPRSLVSAWETGKKQPGPEAVSKLARLFGVPVEDLLDDLGTEDVAPATYSVAQAARILGVSISSIYRAGERGDIRITEFGGRKLVPREEVDRILGRH